MIKLPLKIFTESEDFPFYIQYGYHDEECYLHSHEDFSELVIVLEGSAEHIVENESYLISKGDVFVIDKFTEHGYIGANNFKICNIMFRSEILLKNIFNIRQTAGFHALFILEPHNTQNHHFQSRLKLNASDFTVVKSFVESMIEEYAQKNEGWQTIIYAMFIHLCTLLSRIYQSNEDSNNDILKLASAVAYIEKNFCEEINISTLAQISGYSERQFDRLFKSTFSTTPHLYITNLKIRKAQQLLKNSGLSISDIAWNCGYNDSNYFSRIFKKHIGITPSEYQQKVLY